MPLKSEWLCIIEKLAEQGSMSEAAKQLGYTQQALSYTLGLAEQYFNCALFERHRRVLTLTAAGKQVLSLAQKYTQQRNTLHNELHAFQDHRLSSVWQIVRSDNFSSAVQIAHLLSRLRLAYPEDSFVFDWTVQPQLESVLLKENLALGLSLYPSKNKAICSFQLFETPYVWVSSQRFETSAETVSVAFDYHSLNRAKHILHVSEAYHYLSGLTMPTQNTITSSNMYEVIQLVKAGCGRACVPLIDVQDAIDAGQLLLMETTTEKVSGYLWVAESLVPYTFMEWLKHQHFQLALKGDGPQWR